MRGWNRWRGSNSFGFSCSSAFFLDFVVFLLFAHFFRYWRWADSGFEKSVASQLARAPTPHCADEGGCDWEFNRGLSEDLRAENGTSRKMPFLAWSECISSLAMLSPSVRLAARAIVSSSSVRMTRTATRLTVAEITPAFAALLFTTTSSLLFRLGAGGRGQKLLPTVVAAKVEPLSIAFGMGSGGFVHGHAADGVFGRGFRVFHGQVPYLGNDVIVFLICLLEG